MLTFREKLLSLPLNSFYGIYQDKKYLITKFEYADKKIIKLYAKQLGGNDIVSGNYFIDIKGGLLKPCEMSDKKVINFVLNVELEE